MSIVSLRGSLWWSCRAAVAVAAWCLATGSADAEPITIDWVTVGDPGNAADTTGYGAVAGEYKIMKFEFTNAQYVDFLNAVDPNAQNLRSLYNPQMDTSPYGGIGYLFFAAAGTKYRVRTNMGDKPVNFVDWFDAARVANWMHNGQGSGSTETGAYTLNGATSGEAVARNPGALFYVPNEDEWYKAAYYKGGSANAGYWDYATQSDSAPSPVSAGPTGIGSAGPNGNFANYYQGADWNGRRGNFTTIGTNGGPSAYGALDMSGNALEWNDLDGTPSLFRGYRGGSFIANDSFAVSSAYRLFQYTTTSLDTMGFRLAGVSAQPVPEIDPAGMGSVLALVTGALGLLERRRRKTA